MNQHIKIIVLFLAASSMTGVGFAQQNGNETTESIIIMTKARLDSLLTDIANSKRALLAQREQERLAKYKLKSPISAVPASQKLLRNRMAPYQEKTRNPVRSDARIFQELDRINQRIDLLMLKIISPQNNNNYSKPSGTTIIPNPAGRSPTIIYGQGRTVVPARPRYSENAAGSDAYAAGVQENLNTEIKILQNRMEALRAKIMDLDTTANKREISRLQERIDMLNTKLEEAYRTMEFGNQTNIAKKTSGNNPLIAVLKNYRQKIYFANNSAALNSADEALLLQLAQMIKRSDEQVTVLVQGYASKTGTAMYNYKLSLKRANAVRDVLTGYGISAGKIEILGHGVNKSYTAPAARRAEISLLINERK